jgi:hypothetical protein
MHEMNRFWYEHTLPYDELYWKVIERQAKAYQEKYNSRPMPVCPGTKPDIEIRW